MKERDTLKLHLGEKGLCYAYGFHNASKVEDELAFFDKLKASPPRRIRMLGTREHAPLIVRLFDMQMCVELATPTICTRTERKDANAAMYRIRQCALPSSLGGWHVASLDDYACYYLTSQFLEHGAESEITQEAFCQHPTARYLMFLPDLHLPSLIELLASINDPRWFIDPDSPYRLARLRAYLGLNPSYIRQLDRINNPGPFLRRCQLLVKAWQGKGQPAIKQLRQPENFIWRRHVGAGGGFRGLLRASNAFVTYLSRTWHQAMLQTGSQELEMFVPDSFFQAKELTAYRTFQRGLTGCE
jgi:hypothetical protein